MRKLMVVTVLLINMSALYASGSAAPSEFEILDIDLAD